MGTIHDLEEAVGINGDSGDESVAYEGALIAAKTKPRFSRVVAMYQTESGAESVLLEESTLHQAKALLEKEYGIVLTEPVWAVAYFDAQRNERSQGAPRLRRFAEAMLSRS